MFKNNLTQMMTRNRSEYLGGFNSTQPINRTEIDLRPTDNNKSVTFLKGKMIHNQSPSVSSEGERNEIKSAEDHEEYQAVSNVRQLSKPRQEGAIKVTSHQKKRSQLPNGSFIETKMKNCLHSRNLNGTNGQTAEQY